MLLFLIIKATQSRKTKRRILSKRRILYKAFSDMLNFQTWQSGGVRWCQVVSGVTLVQSRVRSYELSLYIDCFAAITTLTKIYLSPWMPSQWPTDKCKKEKRKTAYTPHEIVNMPFSRKRCLECYINHDSYNYNLLIFEFGEADGRNQCSMWPSLHVCQH